MKILVTGATGFVGNHLVQELLKNDIEVIATSRSIEKAKQYKWFSKVKYIPWDLNEKLEDYFSFFERPNCLIHLAWEGLPNYTDLFHFEKNLFSNYCFLKNMIEDGLKSLVVTGTCFEYGMENGALREDIKTRPNTPYGLAKDCLRKFLELLQTNYYFDFKWIRLFYMYGKIQKPNTILSQLEAALERKDETFNMSSGEQLRDYLPVEKVAEYIVKISMQDKIGGIINCCSGKPISIRKLVEDYLKKKQRSIKLNLGYYPYQDYEAMAFWGDTEKLEKAIGA